MPRYQDDLRTPLAYREFIVNAIAASHGSSPPAADRLHVINRRRLRLRLFIERAIIAHSAYAQLLPVCRATALYAMES